jgi:chromosome segregation ATPase
MRSRILIHGLVAIAMLASSGVAFAQSETDRLREALRQSIAQTRALEDERTALQAKLASAERDKANLKAQVEAAQAETKKAQKQYRDAVEEFNNRLAERDATLDKWKSAYEEAANVARAKDAERAKFETAASACEASFKSCRGKNSQLVKIDRELVRRNADIHFGDKLVAREPLIAVGRVRVQNELQDYTDKILDQKETACAK